jgi:predicted nucleic acid-binding protein
VTEEGRDGAVSSITVYELLRHGYQGRLDRTFAEEAAQSVGIAFDRAGTDEHAVLRRAARITHGMGLPMADALIAASLEHVGCDTLYTGDSDFEAYDGEMEIVFL